jgi:hypothetical protein
LLSGLVLRAFLWYGETSNSQTYGPTVQKTVAWLVAFGKSREGRLTAAPDFSGEARVEHAIAAAALAEYFTMTQEEEVWRATHDALQQIISTQKDGGGWSFGAAEMEGDFRLTSWNLVALYQGREARDKPWQELETAWAKGGRWLATHALPDGRYDHPKQSAPVPAHKPYDFDIVGLCVTARLTTRGDRGDVAKSMDWLLGEVAHHGPAKYQDTHTDLDAWAYTSEAMQYFGGAAWNKWNRWFQEELVRAQNADGSWPVPGGKKPGLQSAETKSGAIYRTAVSVRSLPHEGRWLPLNFEGR